MAVIEIAKIQVRRGQELQTGIPQLDPGEFGWAEDTQHLYIGKRIVDGANSDENTRILTENDLDNFFELINTTSSSILSYQYRKDVAHIVGAPTTVRTVQSKLDETVSLCDFGVVTTTTFTDISSALNLAVQTIYNNSVTVPRKDSRRRLLIPAGNYYVTNTVELPPYAHLIGEGPGLTTLRLHNTVSTTVSMFNTVDADGNAWNDGMLGGVKRSKEITVEGMTLEYSTATISDAALISLDNTLRAQVKNVEFRRQIDVDSTTTYGLVSHGIGIGIRGQGGGLGSGDVNLCENVQINNCKFDSLYTAVETTGSVLRAVIENNIFSNLNRGIILKTVDTTPAPMNAHIVNNRFENIVREGIYSEATSFNPLGTNHISENNFFYQVGNGTGLNDLTTSSQTAVIAFLSSGDRSVNDYFSRQDLAATTANPSFFFNPLVNGVATIINNKTYEKVLAAGDGVTTMVTRFPVTGNDQKIDVDYKLLDGDDHFYTRTGRLLINISRPAESTATFTAADSETIGATHVSLSTYSQGSFAIQAGMTVSGTAFAAGTTVTNIARITVPITQTFALGNSLLCSTVHGLNVGDAFQLDLPIGNMSAGVFYYVANIVSGNRFTVSASYLGPEFTQIDASASVTATMGAASLITLSTGTISSISHSDPILFSKQYDSYGSISDYYNYSHVEEFSNGDPDTAVFTISDPVNNYVRLDFTNWQSQSSIKIEYQISKFC